MSSADLEANSTDAAWAAKADPDPMVRVAILIELATIDIPRGIGWVSPRELPLPVTLDECCFVCWTHDRRLYRHHLITVAHGGSNHARNLVSLCHRCHRTIHPWMPQGTTLERKGGPYLLCDLIPECLENLIRKATA